MTFLVPVEDVNGESNSRGFLVVIGPMEMKQSDAVDGKRFEGINWEMMREKKSKKTTMERMDGLMLITAVITLNNLVLIGAGREFSWVQRVNNLRKMVEVVILNCADCGW